MSSPKLYPGTVKSKAGPKSEFEPGFGSKASASEFESEFMSVELKSDISKSSFDLGVDSDPKFN